MTTISGCRFRLRLTTHSLMAFMSRGSWRRLKPGSKGIKILDDANAEVQWPYAPELYFELLRAARAAIKAADPGAQVQHAGFSSGGLSIVRAHDLFRAGRLADARALLQEYLINAPGEGPVQEIRESDLPAYFSSPGAQRLLQWFDLELRNQALTDAFQVHYYGPWQSLSALMRWLRGKGVGTPLEVWELAKRYGHQGYNDQQHANEVAKLLITATGEGSRFTIFVGYTDWPEKYLLICQERKGTPIRAR